MKCESLWLTMNSCSLMHMCFRTLIYQSQWFNYWGNNVTLWYGWARFRYFWAQCKNEYGVVYI